MHDIYGQALDRLAQASREGRLCPVVGAGLSAQAGAPDWTELIKKLAESFVCDADNPKIWGDLPWAFELLGNHPDGWEKVRQLLYQGTSEGATWTDRSRTEEWSLYDLAVLAILGAFIAPNRPYHVLTYNLDTLLEEQILALGHRAVAMVGDVEIDRFRGSEAPRAGYPSVSRRPALPANHRVTVRVAHPHGVILPPGIDDRKCRGFGGERFLLAPIMSTADYEDLLNEPFGERNLLQVRSLLTYECLFWGFSLTDPNVRRLVRLAGSFRERDMNRLERRQWQHVILMKLQGWNGTSGSYQESFDARLQIKLREFGILRLGHGSHTQHQALVRTLLQRINHKAEFQW